MGSVLELLSGGGGGREETSDLCDIFEEKEGEYFDQRTAFHTCEMSSKCRLLLSPTPKNVLWGGGGPNLIVIHPDEAFEASLESPLPSLPPFQSVLIMAR